MDCTTADDLALMPPVGTTATITDRESVARYNGVPLSAVPETAEVAAQDAHKTHGTTSVGLFVWAGQVTTTDTD